MIKRLNLPAHSSVHLYTVNTGEWKHLLAAQAPEFVKKGLVVGEHELMMWMDQDTQTWGIATSKEAMVLNLVSLSHLYCEEGTPAKGAGYYRVAAFYTVPDERNDVPFFILHGNSPELQDWFMEFMLMISKSLRVPIQSRVVKDN